MFTVDHRDKCFNSKGHVCSRISLHLDHAHITDPGLAARTKADQLHALALLILPAVQLGERFALSAIMRPVLLVICAGIWRFRLP